VRDVVVSDKKWKSSFFIIKCNC